MPSPHLILSLYYAIAFLKNCEHNKSTILLYLAKNMLKTKQIIQNRALLILLKKK